MSPAAIFVIKVVGGGRRGVVVVEAVSGVVEKKREHVLDNMFERIR